MHVGAAKFLGADHLAGSGLHQRRPGEEDGGLFAHHHGFVGHRRHVGPAGGAGAHDHGDLRDAAGTHVGLVEEDPAEVLAVGEDLVLARQVGAARVHQVDAWQAVLQGDGLGPQVLLHGQRIVGAALHRGIVADDHAFHPFDPADPGDDAGGGDLFAVDFVGGKGGKLEERRAGVEQAVDAFAHQQLAARAVPGLGGATAAFVDAAEEGAQGVDLFQHGRGVGRELGGAWIDLGVQDGHGGGSVSRWAEAVGARSRPGDAPVDAMECPLPGGKGPERARLQRVSLNSSRPISMRRISLVPAPIS